MTGFVHRDTDCDYSAAHVTLYTDYDLVGHRMTFTIGRGTEIVSHRDVVFLLKWYAIARQSGMQGHRDMGGGGNVLPTDRFPCACGSILDLFCIS